MRFIGIDYGTKQVGVALSDEGGKLAFPHSVIPMSAGLLSALDALVKKEGVEAVVVGESRNYAGEKNEVMEDIEQFVADLRELTALPVSYEREFLTSALAARQFAPEEKSRKAHPSQHMLDASAAALILQSYLDRKSV